MPLFELGVLELVLLLVASDLVEVVHVELANEGGEVGVLEVLGEDVVGEGEDVLDHEGVAPLGPGDDALVVLVLEDLVGLLDEVADGVGLDSTIRKERFGHQVENKL